MKPHSVLNDWVRWLSIRGVPAEDIAGMLQMPPEVILGVLAKHWRKPDKAVWPFVECTRENVRERKVISWTAIYCRRLFAIGYQPSRIADLLLLNHAAVLSFLRRIRRRVRGKGFDNLEAGFRPRPREKSEELATKRQHDRAWN